MTHPVLGVDHVFLLVEDLDQSAAAYRKLGFTLSPRGLHSAEKGSANYTIIFEDDYVELLGMVAATPGNQHLRDLLAEDGEGLRAVAFRITDAHAARAALDDLGIRTEPVGEFSRPLPLPDGSEGIAAFAVSHFSKGEAPAGFAFMCQHKTRDMVWRPELKSHPNGALEMAAIVAVATDSEATAKGFARLLAHGEIRAIAGGHEVRTGVPAGPHSATIIVLTPEGAAARYSTDAVAATPAKGFAALRIRVADLAATRALLVETGIAAHEGADGAIWVAPAHAGGSIMEFVAA